VYHCMTRVVGSQGLLGDLEKEKLRQLIWRQARFCGLEVITYCVMSNHFHVLVRAPEGPEPPDEELLARARQVFSRGHATLQLMEKQLKEKGELPRDWREGLLRRMGDVSVFMKELKQRFSRWYNKRQGRQGTLWSERFRSVLIEDAPGVVRTVAAYVDLNPVRAGLVEDPKDYRYSGYHEAVTGGREARKGLGSIHESGQWKEAASVYREYLLISSGAAGSSGKVVVSQEEIRKKLRKGVELGMNEVLRLRLRHLSEGMVLGSREYVESVFTEFRDRFGARRRTGARAIKGLPLGSLMMSLRDLKLAVTG